MSAALVFVDKCTCCPFVCLFMTYYWPGSFIGELSPGQTIATFQRNISHATLLVVACCTRLATMLQCVVTCRVPLAQIWKWSNFSFNFCNQQCCDMSRSNVVIVWPELANARPTMSGYVVLKCCDRLAGAEEYFFVFLCFRSCLCACVRACVRVCMGGFGHECVCISLFLISFNILSFVYFFFSPPPADQLCKSSHAYTIQVTNIHWQQF